MRIGHGRNCGIISSGDGPSGLVQQDRPARRKSRATDPGRGAAVTVIDGKQRVARVSESARGSGVEVTERDHDDDRERVQGVINPPARSQHDRGSNLHQRCRTGGVSSPRGAIYTPSHTSTYSPVPAKSLHINQIPTQHTTPRCRNWVQGGGRGATPRKTGVLRTRQVFLRHTCRAGSLPSESSLAGRPTPPAASVDPVTCATVGTFPALIAWPTAVVAALRPSARHERPASTPWRRPQVWKLRSDATE